MTHPREAALIHWLRENQLGESAAILLDALRPFGWMVGQGLLVLRPFTPDALDLLIHWFSEPKALDGAVGRLREEGRR